MPNVVGFFGNIGKGVARQFTPQMRPDALFDPGGESVPGAPSRPKQPGMWRALGAGLVANTPLSGLAPRVAYGAEGAQQMEDYQRWQDQMEAQRRANQAGGRWQLGMRPPSRTPF